MTQTALQLPPLSSPQIGGGAVYVAHLGDWTRRGIEPPGVQFAAIQWQKFNGEFCYFHVARRTGDRRFACGDSERRPALTPCASCRKTAEWLYSTTDAPETFRCQSCIERPLLPRAADVLGVFNSNVDAWLAIASTPVGVQPLLKPGDRVAFVCNRRSLSLPETPSLDTDAVAEFANFLGKHGHWLVLDETLPVGKVWVALAFPQTDQDAP